ncbi:Coatomer subunit zeta-1 [Salvia divinorum]|uniref:Coatomer subunit zeta n=1 Tax=Salvia divinorum TaxID=28513 RepID=A0ABD1HYS5_SALDI
MEFGPFVKNILILDSEGNRVASKFYSDDWPTNEERRTFEKDVFAKTHMTNARTEVEVTMFKENVIVFKFVEDLHFYVTGGEDENELLLSNVLEGVFGAITILLKHKVCKMEALENLDLVLLCIDETLDGGIMLDTDAKSIASKVTSVSLDSGENEQKIGEVLKNAHGKVMKVMGKFIDA